MTPTLSYRPDFDGLRAVAVASVLVFHLHTAVNDTAHTGVTLFFVLSGFLITTLLVQEHERTGSIDLQGFYIRRARRLLPALAAMLGAVTLGAILTGTLDRMLLPVLSTAAYVSNVAQTRIDMGQLDHTWTLAVEEHFYVVWPALLLLTGFRAARWPVVLMIFLVLRQSGVDGYYVIAAGCLVGVLYVNGQLPTLPIVALLVALAGVAVGAVSHSSDALVGGATILMMYVAHRPSRVLSWRPLVAIGRISYGIYLWQYPVIFATESWIRFWPVWVIVVVLATLGLAHISARLVEARFRRPAGLSLAERTVQDHPAPPNGRTVPG